MPGSDILLVVTPDGIIHQVPCHLNKHAAIGDFNGIKINLETRLPFILITDGTKTISATLDSLTADNLSQFSKACRKSILSVDF